MPEIKCPHCHTAFTVDEAGYADIANQVRTLEFQQELNERLAQSRRQFDTEIKLAENTLETVYQQKLAAKERELAELAAHLKSHEKDSQLAVAEAEGHLKAQLAERDQQIAALRLQAKSLEESKNIEKELEIHRAVAVKERELGELNARFLLQAKERELEKQALREQYQAELKQKDEAIAFYKDFKARQSTKMIGESLEQH